MDVYCAAMCTLIHCRWTLHRQLLGMWRLLPKLIQNFLNCPNCVPHILRSMPWNQVSLSVACVHNIFVYLLMHVAFAKKIAPVYPSVKWLPGQLGSSPPSCNINGYWIANAYLSLSSVKVVTTSLHKASELIPCRICLHKGTPLLQ